MKPAASLGAAWARLKRAASLLGPSLLSLCLNLPFVLRGLPLGSFDAYTHIFFADHYRRLWFDLYEAKWFGGFSVASYPPLVHQTIALISAPASALAGLAGGTPQAIRFRAEAAGYCILLLIVLACLPAAVERFALIFVPARAARTASWLAVGLPSVYLAVYSFGQLPTLAASTALLWAMARGWQYSRTGRGRDLAGAVLWAGVTAAAHHAVLLFAVFAGSAVAVRSLQGGVRERWRRIAVWLAAAAAFGALVIWPFLAWSRGYVPQTPIDHASRHNLFTDWLAGYYFFWPMYGPFLLVGPAVLAAVLSRRSPGSVPAKLWRKRRHWPLLAAAGVLFTLGLGGTTPLPRLLFGANWEWLTYDRFSLWAGLTLLPLAGLLVHGCRPRSAVPAAAFTLLTIPFCIYAAFAITWARGQPDPVNVEALAGFLNENTPGGERYITLGFGDQLARLSVLTDARTLDGTYFTGRQIPELRESGLGMIDGAVWTSAGPGSLTPFLERAHHWGVRWAFVEHTGYNAYLTTAGWLYVGQIVPEVGLWENPAVPLTTGWHVPVATDRRAAVWWGLAPLAALAAALLLDIVRAAPRSLAVLAALLIAGWPFWYHAVMWQRSYPGVYFLYTSGVLFAADAIAALIVLGAALALRRLPPAGGLRAVLAAPGAPIHLAFLGIVVFAWVSVPASTDPGLSLAFGLHLCAMGLVSWAVARVTRSAGWPVLALAMTTGALLQSTAGLIEVITQNTIWLSPLNLPWPGPMTAATRGASVVGLADGTRWLRAYGTLPHPNILGGYLVVTLAGPLLGLVHTGRRRWLVPLAGVSAALFLTFSRAAWLALAVLLIGMLLLLPSEYRRRGAAAVGCVAVVGAVMAALLGPLVWVRVTAASSSPLEVSSTVERLALTQWSVEFIRRRPLTGVGASAFGPAMVADGAPGAEPVHNVPLLAMAETGVGGGVAVLGLGLAVVGAAWKRRGRSAVTAVVASGLIGLLVIALFDHYLWSLAPGRLWMATALGLYLGASDSPAGTQTVISTSLPSGSSTTLS